MPSWQFVGLHIETVARSRVRGGCLVRAMLGVVILAIAPACGDDSGPAGSGTGGDEMPEDQDPGPGGPSCVPQVAPPPGWSPDDLEARAQPGTITRVVTLRGDTPLPTEEPSSGHAAHAEPFALTAPRRPFGATTQGPHIHERWGESRKLELSYCITRLLGEDAELEARYHVVTRSLVDTTTEWERVTGANFVHIVADDTPGASPHVSPGPPGVSILRPQCAVGTKAYFGVFTHPTGDVQALTNPVPQAWADPELEPLGGGVLTRSILLNSGLINVFDDDVLRGLLRHELGHVMGFIHEEVHMPDLDDDDCHTSDPRPLTPVDPHSIMTTPGCSAFSDDAEILTHRDRLSAFFLHHTPRPRFETRVPTMGYRFGGAIGGGAEILWHTEGATEGILWRPQVVAGVLSFVEEPFPYSPPELTPPGGWYPNQSEIVIPLRLGAPSSMSLLFHGPGPDVDDLVVFNTGGTATAVPWSHDGFAVPVVGRFDGSDLGRDVVYLYQPGTEDSAVLSADDGVVSVVTEVQQQTAFAYPLAAPYRGTTLPDDILWFDPVAGRFISWRLGSGLLEVVEITRIDQGELGLVPGENIPAIGDFNGDGRADIMWQGVSNQAAGFQEIEDVLWLSQSTPDAIAFATVPKAVGRSHRPFVGDFDGDGNDDIFWHRSWGMTAEGPSAFTTGPSFIWYFDAMGGHETETFVLDGDYSPYVGDFDADGCHDVAWFDAVGDQLHVWRCLPGQRDFDCGVTAQTPPNAAPVGMHWGF
ncbi:hypothetical protein [Paraliomyxa miuraensis]|uniref:hypothetical protein n=1 Tax=Paraliomyxa miuraensis TaxID=376150 RepID=UPI00225C297E|nr:hypothetical protein [Paraliomyxa miuraensis]MCX4241838.1 hypothetical protein [Paraliomyxa miuraensis]